MKHIRNRFIFSALFLILLSACALSANSSVGVTPIAANPGNVGNVPQVAACNPPVPSLSNLNASCADQTNRLGKDSFVISNATNFSAGNGITCPLSPPQNNDLNLSCSGPQNSSFQVISCGSCGASTKPLSNFVCASGYFQDATGNCSVGSGTQGYYPCPSGSHYDNTKQACLDDKTLFVNPQCPGGYDFYLPDQHACVQTQPTQIFDCQTFTVALGACQAINQAGGSGSGGSTGSGSGSGSGTPVACNSACKLAAQNALCKELTGCPCSQSKHYNILTGKYVCS